MGGQQPLEGKDNGYQGRSNGIGFLREKHLDYRAVLEDKINLCSVF